MQLQLCNRKVIMLRLPFDGCFFCSGRSANSRLGEQEPRLLFFFIFIPNLFYVLTNQFEFLLILGRNKREGLLV